MEEIYRRALITVRGMWKHRWLGLGVSWAVALVALGLLAAMPVKYEATARIFANTDSILKPLMTGMTVQPNEDQRIVMLSRVVISRPNVERLITTAGLDAEAKTPAERERIIERVTRTLGLKGSTRDNVYTLAFRDEDPARAKRTIELLTSMFIESSRGGKSDDTEAAKRFIDEQIKLYEGKLQEAETRLKDFKIKNIGISPPAGTSYFTQMADVERVLAQARLDLREAQRTRDAYRARVDAEQAGSEPEPQPAHGVTTAEMDARIAEQRRNLDALLQRYTSRHPDVLGARRVIADLEEQRRNMRTRSGTVIVTAPTAQGGPRAIESLKVSLAQAEASVAALSVRVAEHSSRLEHLRANATQVPKLEAELAQLNRDYEVNKRNYENLVQRRESANISGDMQSVAGMGDFRLVDPPRVSARPVSPNRLILFPLALLLSVAAGLATAFVMQEVRPAFFDGRSLREATGLPVLGVVSMVVGDAGQALARRSLFRFSGGVVALFVMYGVGFAALELTSRHVT